MNSARALVLFAVIAASYLGVLIWVDAKNEVFIHLPRLQAALPLLLSLSVVAVLLRYARWHWLLVRAGYRTQALAGGLAYVAGFAFTVTPGKVGELARIRYLAPQGIPPATVLAAFVFERACDLIAVAMLALMAVSRGDVLAHALAFVAFVLAVLFVTAFNPHRLARLAAWLRLRGWLAPMRYLLVLRDGLAGCRVWLNPLDIAVALFLGFLAWGITAASFAWLLDRLAVALPTLSALAVYPLAMLAGAASFIPGGLGSTEIAIVALLATHGVPVGMAALAAVGIRLTSMWFAVLCGFLAITILEVRELARARLPRSNG